MVQLAKLFSSIPRTNERETELHPTRWRRSEVHQYFDEQCRRFPLRTSGFSPFSSPLTQPHLRPLRALHVPDPPRQNPPSRQRSPSHLQHLRSIAPTPPTKHFSQTHLLQYLIHPRLISLPPLKIVVIAEDRSCWPNLHLFPNLSLFPSISHSFFLPLSIWLSLASICPGANGFLFC